MSKGVKYGRWEDETVERKLYAAGNGVVGLNAASRTCSVTKTAIKIHLEGENFCAVERKEVVGHANDLLPKVEDEITPNFKSRSVRVCSDTN